MRNFFTRLSFTKLTFLMVIFVLCLTTTWVVFVGNYDDMAKTVLGFFGTSLVAMTSFYFGQKTANQPDTLMKEERPESI